MNAVPFNQARHQRSYVSFSGGKDGRTKRTTDEREGCDLGEVGEEEHGDDYADGCESCFEEGREHRLKQFGVYVVSSLSVRVLLLCGPALTAKKVDDSLYNGSVTATNSMTQHDSLE
jgi:hypothetical protein